MLAFSCEGCSTPMAKLRRKIPPRWRRSRRELVVRIALIRLRKFGPTPGALSQLARGWGNPSYRADTKYIRLILDCALEAEGPILECGTGITTLALGALEKGGKVYSLEHDWDWYEKVTRMLERTGCTEVEVFYAPLVHYETGDWYEFPQSLPSDFSLVVCDGPPKRTRGGRIGLWEALGERIVNATIVLDDAERDKEKLMVLEARKNARAVSIGGNGKKFAVIGPEGSGAAQ